MYSNSPGQYRDQLQSIWSDMTSAGPSCPTLDASIDTDVAILGPDAAVTGAVIEFGTKPRKDMRRVLQIDQYLKFGGELPDVQRQQMREELLDAFAPLSLDWKRSVLGHAIRIQEQALRGILCG